MYWSRNKKIELNWTELMTDRNQTFQNGRLPTHPAVQRGSANW